MLLPQLVHSLLSSGNIIYCVFPSARRPGDSGQGESDSEHDTSSDTDNELVSHELIKWKKGRLIGKGAFGKVTKGCVYVVANVSCVVGVGGADGFCKVDCSKGGRA